MSKRQHVPKPAPVVERAVVETSLSEDEAIALAHGVASAAYDFIQARRAGDGDKLPSGRFWFSGGVVMSMDDASQRLRDLALFLAAHPGAGADAAYLHLSGGLAKDGLWPGRPKAFADLPLALRQAYTVYAYVLPPLLGTARAETARIKERECDAAALAAPLPTSGRMERIGARPTNSIEKIRGRADV